MNIVKWFYCTVNEGTIGSAVVSATFSCRPEPLSQNRPKCCATFQGDRLRDQLTLVRQTNKSRAGSIGIGKCIGDSKIRDVGKNYRLSESFKILNE